LGRLAEDLFGEEWFGKSNWLRSWDLLKPFSRALFCRFLRHADRTNETKPFGLRNQRRFFVDSSIHFLSRSTARPEKSTLIKKVLELFFLRRFWDNFLIIASQFWILPSHH
jgi:hypothetical protein